MHPSHISTSEKIISQYKGDQPFHIYLKNYFREYKKAGSKDRKNISQLCYTYFRIGKALMDQEFRIRLAAALMLCDQDSPYLEFLKQELSLPDDFEKAFPAFRFEDIFSFSEPLSEGLNRLDFSKNHLLQPDLHVRLRPGKELVGEKLLQVDGYKYHEVFSFGFQNGIHIEDHAAIDKEVVIQDWSSQQVAYFFPDLPSRSRIWDACAASGGKSLLAIDFFRNPELTVTDKRSSILHNLDIRFKEAGVKNYKSMVTDLSVSNPHKPLGQFDLVIADVPCSGSGTWGRTPEQLLYFNEQKVQDYQTLQRSILKNLYSSVRQHGYMLYVTCSVFKKENEDNVELIASNGFTILKEGLINGAEHQADSMFAALLQKK
jgi:16S rRNA (cytosine967-C5)-methyltransferase